MHMNISRPSRRQKYKASLLSSITSDRWLQASAIGIMLFVIKEITITYQVLRKPVWMTWLKSLWIPRCRVTLTHWLMSRCSKYRWWAKVKSYLIKHSKMRNMQLKHLMRNYLRSPSNLIRRCCSLTITLTNTANLSYNTIINKNLHILKQCRKYLISWNRSHHKQTKGSYLRGVSLKLSRNCQYKKTRQWCLQWQSMVTRRHSLKEVYLHPRRHSLMAVILHPRRHSPVILHLLPYRASRPTIWTKEMLTKILSLHRLAYFQRKKTQLVHFITLRSSNRSYKSRFKWKSFKSNWWESLGLIP